MKQWQETRQKPVLPYYLAAVACLLGAMILHPYTPVGLVGTIALTAVVFVLSSKLCPTRVVRREVPLSTGDETVDTMLDGIAQNLDALHTLNDAIPDPQLSEAMSRMETAGRSILTQIRQDPAKAPQVDRFARYYLPEAVKIMASYARMEQSGARGTNAAQMVQEVRSNAGIIATAFENQLDALYRAEALNLSTDLEVLHTILKSQNLT